MRAPLPAENALPRATLLSLAVHAALVLVPGAVLSLGGGDSELPSEEGFVVSLYPVSSEVRPGREMGPVEPPLPEIPDPPEPEPEPPEPEPEPDTPPTPGGGVAGPAEVSPSKPAESRGPPGRGDPGVPAKATRYQPPRLLAGALPIDPEDSGEMDVPDEIPVKLRVGKTGKVLEVVPEDLDLSAPVLAAIKKSAGAMRFAPARVGKNPVESWFSMTFIYRR